MKSRKVTEDCVVGVDALNYIRDGNWNL
ncbi:hypothetical protein E2C01_065231 [Portunus trituberculatus]|uniref:Uncharacterized protein n=1 Tax=Portunus trituberculatus TaxID=210409 RepID=A0A5B7HMV6_PORTR|nr:hypothetical protein [Portunus trituberculatus]